MELLNRQAIVVRPRNPMVQWVRQVDIDLGNEPLDEETIRSHTNVYLIPDDTMIDKPEPYLQENVRMIFEYELKGWYTVPDLWPDNRDWETFCDWMAYQTHPMVLDLESAPIVTEPWD